MTGYTEKTDVWAIGVTALWMIHGRHPWNSSYNPWRHEDPTSERIRPLFHEMYTEGVANLTGIKNKGRLLKSCFVAVPLAISQMTNLSFQALKEAIRAMIRHPYAEKNSQKGARVSAAQALDMLTGKSEQPRKKARDSGH
jgi:serine/threonine protein kinase